MKYNLLILCSSIFVGCTHPKVFVLNDTTENKYFLSESINDIFDKNQIEECPLIVIDGRYFYYNKKNDTIKIPLKKSDIISVNFLNINSSRIIYNEKENDGAVIITTKNQKK